MNDVRMLVTHEGCEKCQRAAMAVVAEAEGCPCAELYTVQGLDGWHLYNVTKAKALIQRGERKIFHLPAEFTQEVLRVNVPDPRHVDHVCTDDPCILGTTLTPEGLKVLMIDGTHRAARLLKQGEQARAKLLMPEETAACELPWEMAEPLIGREYLHNQPTKKG